MKAYGGYSFSHYRFLSGRLCSFCWVTQSINISSKKIDCVEKIIALSMQWGLLPMLGHAYLFCTHSYLTKPTIQMITRIWHHLVDHAMYVTYHLCCNSNSSTSIAGPPRQIWARQGPKFFDQLFLIRAYALPALVALYSVGTATTVSLHFIEQLKKQRPPWFQLKF